MRDVGLATTATTSHFDQEVAAHGAAFLEAASSRASDRPRRPIERYCGCLARRAATRAFPIALAAGQGLRLAFGATSSCEQQRSRALDDETRFVWAASL